ncbi:MAG TPA: PAS domain S-box protein [Desulfocapsa sulfexigens]|nr:PAS domain S-box protein [Desulfocapsa sulfexigens]
MNLSSKQPGSSLGKHLLGIYLVSLIFLVATLLAIQVIREYRAINQSILTSGQLIINTLRASVVDPVVKTLSYDRLDTILGNVYKKNKSIQCIRVYEVPDHLASAVGTPVSGKDNSQEIMEMLLQTDKDKLVQQKEGKYIFWSLLKIDNEIIGLFRMAISPEQYKKRLYRSVLLFLGFALLLATISSWLFTEYLKRRIIEPLSATSEIMGHFQHTNLDQYLTAIDTIRDKLPNNEIGNIATSYRNVVLMVQQRRRELERIVTAIEQTSESIVTTDSKGNIQFVNPAFEVHSGYSAAEVQGQNPRILKSDQQEDSFFRELWATISSGKKWNGTFINKKKDGTLILEESSISPIISQDGQITNYVAVNRDITKEANLEQQLNQAQRLESIGRLAGGVAHDFNNILTVINGHTQLALLKMKPEDPLREDVQVIQDAGAKAARLVQQLLAFSRKQIIRQEILHLGDEIQATKKMLDRLLGEDINIILLLDNNIWPVMADRAQFEQILINLAVNSRDAMPDGGKLTIEAFNLNLSKQNNMYHQQIAIGDYVMLRVSDTGEGMSPEIQKLMFEPFFTTKDVGKGTGLGMSTVYGIVKQNNGWIDVASEPGKGTTLSLYFPRCFEKSAPPLQSSEATQNLDQLDQGIATILLVEDDKEVRKLFIRLLSNLGYTVLEAIDGEDALRVSSQFHDTIHLLLTDVVMPKMHGSEVAKILKQKRPEMKVLFMSGYTEDTITRHGVLKDGINFLQKPVAPETMATAIHDILSGNNPRA